MNHLVSILKLILPCLAILIFSSYPPVKAQTGNDVFTTSVNSRGDFEKELFQSLVKMAEDASAMRLYGKAEFILDEAHNMAKRFPRIDMVMQSLELKAKLYSRIGLEKKTLSSLKEATLAYKKYRERCEKSSKQPYKTIKSCSTDRLAAKIFLQQLSQAMDLNDVELAKQTKVEATSLGLNQIDKNLSSSPPRGPFKDIDFGPYMDRLTLKIYRYFAPLKGQIDGSEPKIIARLKLRRDGSIAPVTWKKLSDNKLLNEAARIAIESASPFEKVPYGGPEEVEIQIDFPGRHMVFEE